MARPQANVTKFCVVRVNLPHPPSVSEVRLIYSTFIKCGTLGWSDEWSHWLGTMDQVPSHHCTMMFRSWKEARSSWVLSSCRTSSSRRHTVQSRWGEKGVASGLLGLLYFIIVGFFQKYSYRTESSCEQMWGGQIGQYSSSFYFYNRLIFFSIRFFLGGGANRNRKQRFFVSDIFSPHIWRILFYTAVNLDKQTGHTERINNFNVLFW